MEKIPLVEVDRLPPLRSALLAQLLSVWRGLFDSGRCGRRQIDPAALVKTLPHIWIYDRIDGRWFCRLAGEEVRYQNGRVLHKRWLEDFIPGPGAADVASYFDSVADRPGLGHVVGPVWSRLDNPVPGERLVMPLWNATAAGEGPADGLLGATLRLEGADSEDFPRRRSLAPIACSGRGPI